MNNTKRKTLLFALAGVLGATALVGCASWSRYPEVYKSEPFFRTKKEAWELFRIGAVGSYQTDPAKRGTPLLRAPSSRRLRSTSS